MFLKLLNAATATNSPPSGATAGKPLRRGATDQATGQGFDDEIDVCELLVASTAGSGTMTVTIKLWGYSSVSAAWHPLGVGTDALKGVINNGVALGEVSSDNIVHAELVALRNFERIYAEITAIGGSSTAISAWLEARG